MGSPFPSWNLRQAGSRLDSWTLLQPVPSSLSAVFNTACRIETQHVFRFLRRGKTGAAVARAARLLAAQLALLRLDVANAHLRMLSASLHGEDAIR